MRKRKIDTPVIMLTARGEEYDKLAGLEGGADDYVVKPFSPRELAARVKVVLARTMPKTQEGGESFVFGDLVMNTASWREVFEEAHLRPRNSIFHLMFLISTDNAFPGKRFCKGGTTTITARTALIPCQKYCACRRCRDNIVTVWGIIFLKFDDVSPENEAGQAPAGAAVKSGGAPAGMLAAS